MEHFFAGEDSFLVLYGDILIDQDLHGMIEQHRSTRADATLLVHRRSRSNSIIELDDDNRIRSFIERPSEDVLARYDSFWVNSGVQLLSWSAVAGVARGQEADLPKDVYVPRIRELSLYADPLTGFRVAVDSMERLEQARQGVALGHYRCPGA